MDYDLVDELLRLKGAGVSFDRVLTLGRQNYGLSEKLTRKLYKKHGLDCTWTPPNPYPANYADGLFTALGAKRVDSLDMIPTESPTIIHDLNQPFPKELHDSFDILLDSGTLEHVFNLPEAFSSCMRAVKRGGKLIIATVANNYMGHGFFQFSPELFFALLSEQNGFRVDRLLVIEESPKHRRFEAISPEVARRRVETISPWRLNLICIASKLADKPLVFPQQSDYVGNLAQIGGHCPHTFHKPAGVERLIVEGLPRLAMSLKTIKYSGLRKNLSLRNKAGFKRVS